MVVDTLYGDAPRGADPDEWAARLALHLTPGVGPARFHGLLHRFGSARAALAASPLALRNCVNAQRLVELLSDSRGHHTRIVAASRAASVLGCWVLLHVDPGYPQGLLRLLPCPPALWIRGTLPPRSSEAIVGTRRASGRACALAATLAGETVRAGRTVVSGGAYGVDAAAHRGALDQGGTTIVVLGGGLDRPYPERHIPLFEAAAQQGALVSPFPPGTPPVRGGFRARNAVIAALSEAVTVVEAPWRSGALSTARIARRLGLPVLAVPGSPGTDGLLRQGARPAKGSGLENGTSGEAALPLDEAEHQVLGVLRDLGVCSVEEMAARTTLSPLEVVAALMTLLVEGHARPEPGGRYCSQVGAQADPEWKKGC